METTPEQHAQSLIDQSIQWTSIYDLIMTTNHPGYMHERLLKAQEFIKEKHSAIKSEIDLIEDQHMVHDLLQKTMGKVTNG